MSQLVHRTQPTHNSCVATCLAMLAGIDCDQQITDITDEYLESYWKLLGIMHRLDITAIPMTVSSSMYYGRVYLVVVSSLNIPDGTHQIIVDLRPERWVILDPAKGRDGRRYYIPPHQEPENDLEVQLKAQWFPEFWIIDAPALRVAA